MVEFRPDMQNIAEQEGMSVPSGANGKEAQAAGKPVSPEELDGMKEAAAERLANSAKTENIEESSKVLENNKEVGQMDMSSAAIKKLIDQGDVDALSKMAGLIEDKRLSLRGTDGGNEVEQSLADLFGYQEAYVERSELEQANWEASSKGQNVKKLEEIFGVQAEDLMGKGSDKSKFKAKSKFGGYAGSGGRTTHLAGGGRLE